jgi:hypothetical protein
VLGRLLFLDNTLKAIIKRFEDEYPETRVAPIEVPVPPETSPVSPLSFAADPAVAATDVAAADDGAGATPVDAYFASDSDGSASDGETGADRKKRRGERPGGGGIRSRQPSDVSLAAKKLAQEEGAVHRLGTEVRRKMLERASAEAEKTAEAAASGADGAISGEAAEATAAIIDARAGDEKDRRRSEEEEEEVREQVRALKEKLRALDSTA